MQGEHYRIVATWFERVGLAIAVSLVIQKIFSGASFTDPTVITGAAVSLVSYALALHLLIKS